MSTLDESALRRAVVRQLQRNPGSTCVGVAKALEIAPGIVRAVLQDLRREERLRSEGRTKGTRYWIVSGR